jgi:hypothetical protein
MVGGHPSRSASKNPLVSIMAFSRMNFVDGAKWRLLTMRASSLVYFFPSFFIASLIDVAASS